MEKEQMLNFLIDHHEREEENHNLHLFDYLFYLINSPELFVN